MLCPDLLAYVDNMKSIEQSGLSMTELARKAGISRVGLYAWIKREGMGKAETAQKLARALGVTVEQLLKEKRARR